MSGSLSLQGTTKPVYLLVRLALLAYTHRATQRCQRFCHFASFGFDQVNQLLWCAGILILRRSGINGFEVIAFGLDFLPRDCPASLTLCPLRQEPEEIRKFVQGQRRGFAYLEIGEVIIPDALSWVPF